MTIRGKEFTLPATEFTDVTPELIARILTDLPPTEEGTFAITVKTDSLRRLLEHAGATVTARRIVPAPHPQTEGIVP